MPVLDVKEIQGFAHCANFAGRCPGYAQEPVDAIREEVGWTFQENGGDIPGVERSHVHIKFAHPEADGVCPHCSNPREVSDQQRKIYQEMIPGGDLPPMPAPEPANGSAELADLRAQIEALTAVVENAKQGGDES